MNKKTVALSTDQYEQLILTIRSGVKSNDPEKPNFRPNERVAVALVLEGNLGIRIGDILQLKLSSFIRDGSRYRLNIVEEKTGKQRTFTVPYPIYQFAEN